MKTITFSGFQTYCTVDGRRTASSLHGYQLTPEAEDAIFTQRWDALRSWAVATALREGDGELVNVVADWIRRQSRTPGSTGAP